MNREEFELEFHEKIRLTYLYSPHRGTNWHTYVESNMHILSDDALRFITKNSSPMFSMWVVLKAIDLTAFEDIILKG